MVNRKGGLITFVKQTMSFDEVKNDKDMDEHDGVKCHMIDLKAEGKGHIRIVNLYVGSDTVLEKTKIWCLFQHSKSIITEDLNAKSHLWGRDENVRRQLFEELLDENNYVTLNDGRSTTYDVRGYASAIDLTYNLS